MKRNFGPLSLAAVSIFLLVLAGCTNNNLVLRYVTITPQTATATVGGSQVNFTAQAYYSNGTVTDGTGLVLWSSSNPAVATVQGGVATPLTPGTTTISATASGTPGATAVLTVNQVTAIAVTPTTTVPLGGSQQYDAVATFNDGTTADVTTLASWSTSNPAAVSIGLNTGLATVATSATIGSNVTINAFYGVNGTATLTVGPATATTLQITTTPATPNIAIGNSVTLVAQEVYTDSSVHPPANAVVWANGTATTAGLVTLSANNNETSIASGLAAGTTSITATDGTLTTSVTVTVVTGSTHYAYVSNSGDKPSGDIEWYNVTASTSPYLAATSGNTLSTPHGPPAQTIIHPNGQFLYFLDSAANINTASINSGALTLPTGTPVAGASFSQPAGSSNDTTFVVVDPFGRFLYVSDDGSGSVTGNSSITGFTINSDGSLTPTGSPITGTNATFSPECLIIDRSGSYLYATDQSGNTVDAYSITQSTGVLVPLPAPNNKIPTGAGPFLGTLDPSGTHLYIADNTDVAAFTIGAGGVLTAVSGSPFTVPGAVLLTNVLVDPADANIYILDAGPVNASLDGQVLGFALNSSTGAINTGSAVSGTPIDTGNFPTGGFVIDPTGSLLANENNNDNTISLFTIKAGVVTAASPATVNTGSAPLFVTFYNAP